MSWVKAAVVTANGRRRLSAITGGVGPSWSALPAILPVHRDVSQSQEGNPGGLPWTPVSQGQVVEKAVAVGHAAPHSSRAVCWFSKETAAEEPLALLAPPPRMCGRLHVEKKGSETCFPTQFSVGFGKSSLGFCSCVYLS